jgi:hypothetical protein
LESAVKAAEAGRWNDPDAKAEFQAIMYEIALWYLAQRQAREEAKANG